MISAKVHIIAAKVHIIERGRRIPPGLLLGCRPLRELCRY